MLCILTGPNECAQLKSHKPANVKPLKEPFKFGESFSLVAALESGSIKSLTLFFTAFESAVFATHWRAHYIESNQQPNISAVFSTHDGQSNV